LVRIKCSSLPNSQFYTLSSMQDACNTFSKTLQHQHSLSCLFVCITFKTVLLTKLPHITDHWSLHSQKENSPPISYFIIIYLGFYFNNSNIVRISASPSLENGDSSDFVKHDKEIENY